ncbi:MAG TPA: methyltransferase [Usitatibacter sp.]|jgi:SAM-dependent methyltransferase|nr:methyltransferase [Usitatibacter sp.]
MSNPSPILAQVADYYSAKLAEHGASPRGVDWNGEESQVLRFRQLARIIDEPASFALNDVGCGYGALYDFLAPQHAQMRYLGCDISPGMVTAARERHPGAANASFVQGAAPPERGDYSVASGILNVRLQHTDAEWREHMQSTLDLLDRLSTRGFAFNCLTSYSDADRMRDYLYYADPCEWFDRCKRRYAKDVALLHDYGLYEFTILVRKAP